MAGDGLFCLAAHRIQLQNGLQIG